MDNHTVNKETSVVYETYKSNIFAMIPCMTPRTGRGLARYIQSLHQYQMEQEIKSEPIEVYQEHMRSLQKWRLR